MLIRMNVQHIGMQDMHADTHRDTERTSKSEICWFSRSVLQYSSTASCSLEGRRVAIPLDAGDVWEYFSSNEKRKELDALWWLFKGTSDDWGITSRLDMAPGYKIKERFNTSNLHVNYTTRIKRHLTTMKPHGRKQKKKMNISCFHLYTIVLCLIGT